MKIEFHGNFVDFKRVINSKERVSRHEVSTFQFASKDIIRLRVGGRAGSVNAGVGSLQNAESTWLVRNIYRRWKSLANESWSVKNISSFCRDRCTTGNPSVSPPSHPRAIKTTFRPYIAYILRTRWCMKAMNAITYVTLGERERERKGNRERNENRSLWGCFVLSTALPSNQTNHLSWKSCRNSKILVVEGRKNVFMIVFFLFSSFCAECAFWFRTKSTLFSLSHVSDIVSG